MLVWPYILCVLFNVYLFSNRFLLENCTIILNWPKEELSLRYCQWWFTPNHRRSENWFRCGPPLQLPTLSALHPLHLLTWCNSRSLLPPFAENPSRDHGAGLRQDRQERRHWEDTGGQQGHGGGAQTLVRHAGQPPPPHRPVASTAAGGGGGRRRRSHNCQEVKLPPTLPPAPPQNTSLPAPPSPASLTSTRPPPTYPPTHRPFFPRGPPCQCVFLDSTQAPSCAYYPFPPSLPSSKRSIHSSIRHDGKFILRKTNNQTNEKEAPSCTNPSH